MSPRLVTSLVDEPLVRRSVKVARVAEILDDVPSQVRRMVARGDLEAHQQGKRGVRVYLDSVEAWQSGNPIKAGKASASAPAAPPKPMAGATKAAHRHAVAHLQALGLVPASRR